MAPASRIVIHHVRGRLTGIRRIVGTSLLPDGAPTSLTADEGDGPRDYQLVAERERYVLYRELNTPSLLVTDGATNGSANNGS